MTFGDAGLYDLMTFGHFFILSFLYIHSFMDQRISVHGYSSPCWRSLVLMGFFLAQAAERGVFLSLSLLLAGGLGTDFFGMGQS